MSAAKVILALSLTLILSGYVGEALDCCSAYTDVYGKEHKVELCQEFCCLDISLDTITQGSLKKCCSNEDLRVPSDQRTDECLVSWISQNIWVPIVGGIGLLIIIIIIVACCCCCCRN